MKIKLGYGRPTFFIWLYCTCMEKTFVVKQISKGQIYFSAPPFRNLFHFTLFLCGLFFIQQRCFLEAKSFQTGRRCKCYIGFLIRCFGIMATYCLYLWLKIILIGINNNNILISALLIIFILSINTTEWICMPICHIDIFATFASCLCQQKFLKGK